MLGGVPICGGEFSDTVYWYELTVDCLRPHNCWWQVVTATMRVAVINGERRALDVSAKDGSCLVFYGRMLCTMCCSNLLWMF